MGYGRVLVREDARRWGWGVLLELEKAKKTAMKPLIPPKPRERERERARVRVGRECHDKGG